MALSIRNSNAARLARELAAESGEDLTQIIIKEGTMINVRKLKTSYIIDRVKGCFFGVRWFHTLCRKGVKTCHMPTSIVHSRT